MSVTLAHAFLEAYNPASDLGETLFWQDEEFVGHGVVPPWYDTYEPAGHPILSLDATAVDKIRVFVHRFWELRSVDAKKKLITNPGDSDGREGLAHCRKYIERCMDKWRINEHIDAYVDLPKVYHCQGPELPTLEDSYVLQRPEVIDILIKLFGTQALNAVDPTVPQHAYAQFVWQLVALRWNTYRKRRKAAVKLVRKLEGEQEALVGELSVSTPGTLQPATLRKIDVWTRQTATHISYLRNFHDPANADLLDRLKAELHTLPAPLQGKA
ncbi:unnamed protein product [Peniophora sp. CBMAI 1063]|nr:unnamed protein product [Peniophora sp. CBMAI 1063]